MFRADYSEALSARNRGREMAPELPRARPQHSAILPQSGGKLGPEKAPRGVVCKRCFEMKDTILRVVTNEKLTRITHWTVFSVGALTLAFSVAATAARAF